MLAAQVAVALAHAAAERATVEQAPAQLDYVVGETLQLIQLARRDRVRAIEREFSDVSPHQPPYRRRRAVLPSLVGGGRAMKGGEPSGDRANLRSAHAALGHHPIEHRGLSKPAHPDRPLHRRARLVRAVGRRAQRQLAAAAPQDRNDAQVNVRREPPVKPHLVET